MEAKEPKFLVDVMLGKLAKWLRILGYDTEYVKSTSAQGIPKSTLAGRILLTRKKDAAGETRDYILIRSERLDEQLRQLRESGLKPDRSRWFTRCLKCNRLLQRADLEQARDSVPDYVLYENGSEIRFCTSCMRYYWPGSHREKMVLKLANLGF
ncbi:MAG: hypothetical protein JRJ03_06830 [Deltaproteobacteria bacterium]|nr:hypothetical protein [Deltaproteobacteria bacterium]